MEKENFNLMMEVIMLANGKIIKCTASGNCITKMAKLPIKETGITISFVVSAEFLMINLKSISGPSTIMILLISDKNGYITKGNSKMIPSMEKAKLD